MRALLVSLIALGTLASTASADTWPSRPVTFVIPLPAGGPMDVMARPMLQQLQEKWGKPAIIENKGGATGTIGTGYVTRAEPDGHTLLYTVDLPITMAPNLIKVPYDPATDLELIATFAETEQVLVVHPSVGVKNFQELVAKAKANPGVMTYASGGIATPAHLCIEGIMQASGTRAVHVPYRGAAPAMNGLVAGEVDMFCGPLAQALPFITSGRLTAIATSASRRAALTPQIPTLIEAGLKDFTFTAQYYLMAPKGVAKDVLARIRADFKAVLESADTQKRFAAMAVYPKWIEGEDAMKQIRGDLARWGDIIRNGNIKAE